MEVNKTVFDKLYNGHQDFVKRAEIAEKYYANANEIKATGAVVYKNEDAAKQNPLKLADNRISHDWHRMLVTQKVGYALTYPPTFDVGTQQANKKIANVLGDEYAETAARLGTDASNCSVAWLHYWQDDNGKLRYHAVDPKQVIPVYSDRLDERVTGVLRCYTQLNPETGQQEEYREFWDDKKVRFYKQDTNGLYVTFAYPEIGEEMTHDFGEVPFIPFYNNSDRTSDLLLYKDLIDAYDKVFSGFANDMEDVQQIIFILKNYGGQDRTEFIQDLMLSKAIKVDGDGGVDTIRAEIPYEARGAFLERTRKQIFISGMGVDPDPENFGNTSGVALQFLYSLLELKAGLLETQFRKGFAQLVRAICRHEGMKEPEKIVQTWTRNMIRNDQEAAQIAAQSQGVISDATIVRNHPWVEDAEEELKTLEEEKQQAQEEAQQYGFPAEGEPQEEDNDKKKPDSDDEE